MPLANVTLGANAAVVTFSSINQTYRDLALVITGRTSTSTASVALQFNGVTSGYSMVTMEGNGSATASVSDSNTLMALGLNYAYLTTGGDSVTLVNVMDYTATDKHKTVLARTNNASSAVAAVAGRWASTAAVTSVTVRTGNGNPYATGTTMALYGVSA